MKLISKNYLSPDCSLKFENMKSKSLVIVKSMLRWINSQILHTPPITLEKLLGLENKSLLNDSFIGLLISLIVIWVKLTQGTGRGTCWWSIYVYYKIFFTKVFELLFSQKFDIYLYATLEDIFVVLMLYSFIKLILLSSVVELIWPTQFFNRRNSSNISIFRLRTFTETFLKLRSNNITISQLLVFINFR